MRSKQAFTLIELLAVMTIIALLAAITFPAFAGAKDQAKQTRCLSNLRQLATAIAIYRSQYEGESAVGDMYTMGLPPQPILSSLPVANLLGQCDGPSRPPNLSQTGFAYWYTPAPPGFLSETPWADYVGQVGDQAILFMDLNHNPVGTALFATDVTKFGIGVALDSHVVRKRATGDPWELAKFWN